MLAHRMQQAASGLIVPTGAYQDLVLADAPHIYYRYEQTSGTVAADSSGNGLNGTYASGGNTLGTAGLLSAGGYAVGMDPSAGAVGIDSGDATNLTTACTLETLFKADATIQASAHLISKNQYYASGYSEFPIRLALFGGTLSFDLSKGDNYAMDLSLTQVVSSGTAYHAVGVYRSNGQCELWLNGVMVASQTIAFAINTNTRTWRFGKADEYSSGVGTSSFGGVLDESAVYGSALSATRIQAHFAATGL